MEFGTEKCSMLVMKSGKQHLNDGMELQNQDNIRRLGENEAFKYLGILEANTIKQVEMKDKIQKEFLRRKLPETKLSSRNLIKLAQKEYKTRHNWVGKVIHGKMSKKFKFDHTNKWYMLNSAPVLENNTHKLLWDFDTHTDHIISARKPDLIIINKRKREFTKVWPLLFRLTTE